MKPIDALTPLMVVEKSRRFTLFTIFWWFVFGMCIGAVALDYFDSREFAKLRQENSRLTAQVQMLQSQQKKDFIQFGDPKQFDKAVDNGFHGRKEPKP